MMTCEFSSECQPSVTHIRNRTIFINGIVFLVMELFKNVQHRLYIRVGIETGYGRGSVPGRGKTFFSAPQRPAAALTLGVMPVREADLSSPSSDEFKNSRSMSPPPPYVFMASSLIN
jgi:hypothetical protein